MGCANTHKDIALPLRTPTVTGLLKVTIVEANLQHKTTSFFNMDPYVKLKLTNQTYKTQPQYKAHLSPKYNQSFNFYVNSCYKKYGRCLEVEVWDSRKTSDDEIGFGMIDLDPLINNKLPRLEQRKLAGIVHLVTQFKQEKSETLSFRFETVSIRRKTRTFGDMNCHVEVVIGQQCLSTSESKDTKQIPPTWPNDILTFNVPLCLKQFQILVLDGFDVVGSVTMITSELLINFQEKTHAVDITHQGVENAGTLKFQTIAGSAPKFKPLPILQKKQEGNKVTNENKKQEKQPKEEKGKKESKNQVNGQQPQNEEKKQPKKQQINPEQPPKQEQMLQPQKKIQIK